MDIMIYPPEKQGIGEFDGGKITEQKPIGFPHERTTVKRVGPLFYWAWAKADQAGYIPSHPHQGFEIITYVIHGKAEHGDSLGTKSTVGAGGAQVMQTGSGVSHEEGFIGPNMEGFQIWFEPNLKRSIKDQPTYHQYEHEDFPVEQTNDYSRKTIIGEKAPVTLKTSVNMWDIAVKPSKTISFDLQDNRSLAILAIRGVGSVMPAKTLNDKDFLVAHGQQEEQLTIQATSNEALRLIAIEVPQTVDYPLYSK